MSFLKKFGLPILAIVSLLIGVIWRGEIESHGWNGLIWLSYFHVAIPVGFGLFLLWANTQIVVTFKKRLLFNVLAIVLGFAMAYAITFALTWLFSQGPSAMQLLTNYPMWLVSTIAISPLLLLPAISYGAMLVLKSVGYRTPLNYLLWSTIIIWISIPTCQGLLEVTNHIGGDDLIHVVKSGFFFPFLAFAVGLVIAKSQPRISEAVK